jgi:pectinesterase
MKSIALYLLLIVICGFLFATGNSVNPEIIGRFPAQNAANVNPDAHLKLTFASQPTIGKSGKIRVYDATNNRLVDTLDLSVPPGPTTSTPSPNAIYTPVPYEYKSGRFTNANTKPGTPSGGATPTSDIYQLNIIGGFTDAFHFYPIIVHDNIATIYLHNNLFEYGKTYYVEIDPEAFVLKEGKFAGIAKTDEWKFSTKKAPPSLKSRFVQVNDDGSGDFNTVQGALDFVPDNNDKPFTISVRKGIYEEIVYFRNKANIEITGEDREKTVLQYANSEVFNPHPDNLRTNEVPGTFPSRRATFAIDHCNNITIANLSIKNTAYGQAEGLLINGEKIFISNVTIKGSGDALQSNGTVYYYNSRIIGDGDTILGRGPAFFNNCEINSQGPYMWIRNTAANHGNVFVNCTFKTTGNQNTVIARSPTNGGKNYPYAEAVLINCALSGIDPVGWGAIGGDPSNVHYWEYNSTNLSDGKPVDVSKRHPASRQLTLEKDAAIIKNHQDPAYVLGGWKPRK